MSQKKLLFIGFGDIAKRCSRHFLALGHSVVGIARSDKGYEGLEFWQGAVRDDEILNKVSCYECDAAIITLTPNGSGELGYQEGYVNNLTLLFETWKKNNNWPKLILYVSSTSVYAQNNGEWVDENSETCPEHFRGRLLLEAESIVQKSPVPHCIVRFSGIYGPGRHYLINQVRQGLAGSQQYANRIHVDDCAGVLGFLCEQYWRTTHIAELYVCSDSCPEKSGEVRQWLARTMGYPVDHLRTAANSGSRGGNKRCSNKRLLDAGYVLRYPSYRDGYPEILAGMH